MIGKVQQNGLVFGGRNRRPSRSDYNRKSSHSTDRSAMSYGWSSRGISTRKKSDEVSPAANGACCGAHRTVGKFACLMIHIHIRREEN